MYQCLAKPFKSGVINWLCIYNESSLFIISLMQTIFITDIRQVSVVVNIGWAMIALTVSMIFINFIVVITHVVKNKFKKTNANIQSEFPDFQNNTMTNGRNSAITFITNDNMHTNSRRL